MPRAEHDSDSDVSELDARELSEALPANKWASMLGYCEDPEIPLTADTFPSKSGGKPAWLNPETLLEAEQVTCRNCCEPMVLLLQLYTPEDQPKEAFHRTVYVFCCRNGGCVRQDWTKSFKVFRSQLPRENPYYPPPEDDDDDDDKVSESDVIINFVPKAFTKPTECAICGLHGTKMCGKCHSTHYCSRQHQLVDWNSCGHKEFCNSSTISTSDASRIAKLRAVRLFAEKEIVSEPEGEGEENEEEQGPSAHTQVAALPQSDEMVSGLKDDDKYENSKVDVDDTFLKFQLKIGLYPDQVIRYERVEYDMPDREPLWVQKNNKPSVVPDCERCGGPRTLEFQILSTILNYLDVSHDTADSLDWGSLYIYSCKHNCPLGNDVFASEYIWKQEFSTDGMDLNKTASRYL